MKPDLQSLPPTRDSAQQHSYKVYLPVPKIVGKPAATGMDTRRGWNISTLMTKNTPAPDTILRTISCNYTSGCGVRCGCRKAGIKCRSVFGNLKVICTNRPPLEDKEFDEESEL